MTNMDISVCSLGCVHNKYEYRFLGMFITNMDIGFWVFL